MRFCLYVVTALMVASLLMSFEGSAFAYGDPGSSLLMLQSAGAIVSGVLFFVRKRLRDLLGRREHRSDVGLR